METISILKCCNRRFNSAIGRYWSWLGLWTSQSWRGKTQKMNSGLSRSDARSLKNLTKIYRRNTRTRNKSSKTWGESTTEPKETSKTETRSWADSNNRIRGFSRRWAGITAIPPRVCWSGRRTSRRRCRWRKTSWRKLQKSRSWENR